MTQHGELIVITGASRGIGLALVNRFLDTGSPVLGVARDTASMTAHHNLTTLDADLASRAGISRVSVRVAELGLPVTVLINNAGVQNTIDLAGPEIEDPERPDLIRDEIALNLTAPILLTLALLPFMLRPGGTVVNVTSLVSRQPKPSAPVYSASKAGLASFTQSLRVQLRSQGVRVVEAVPPLVDTGMTSGRGTAKISPEAMADAILQGVAKQRQTVAPDLSRRVLILNRLLPELVRRILTRS